jgi:uncharacterized protein involved in cysteine biosynthesis
MAASIWRQLLSYSQPGSQLSTPSSVRDRLLYGCAQPVLALRMLVSSRVLLLDALFPVLMLAGFCSLSALLHLKIGQLPEDEESIRLIGFWTRFFAAFAMLAPLPSILFAAHYARLAATAYRTFSLGDCEPRRESLFRSAIHALKQAAVISIAVAPLVGLAAKIPHVGTVLAASLGAVWALHWVVVEAFDSARVHATSPSGLAASTETSVAAPDVDSQANPSVVPEIWFVRACEHAGARIPVVGFVVRWFAALCRYLAKPWKEEIALTEQHTVLMLGFAVMTALLLATPILNLLFRPTIVIAAVHLLAHLPRTAPKVVSVPADSASR